MLLYFYHCDQANLKMQIKMTYFDPIICLGGGGLVHVSIVFFLFKNPFKLNTY